LPIDLVDASDNDSDDEALHASHGEGITFVGAYVGSPVITIPESGSGAARIAFFGALLPTAFHHR
jgi:hypothetical protein